MLPEPDEGEGPTLEEQKDAAEAALRMANKEKADTAKALAEREEELVNEQKRLAQTEHTVEVKEGELGEAAGARTI